MCMVVGCLFAPHSHILSISRGSVVVASCTYVKKKEVYEKRGTKKVTKTAASSVTPSSSGRRGMGDVFEFLHCCNELCDARIAWATLVINSTTTRSC